MASTVEPFDFKPRAAWRERFRVHSIVRVTLATQNPSRGGVLTDLSGKHQIYAWDLASGKLAQRTNSRYEQRDCVISADGEWLYHFDIRQDGIAGHLQKVHFEDHKTHDVTPSALNYMLMHVTESADGSMLGFTYYIEGAFRTLVRNQAEETVFSLSSQYVSNGPNLSYDGEYAVMATTEYREGDYRFDLEIWHVSTGKLRHTLRAEKAHERRDEVHFSSVGFVPRANDPRLLYLHYRQGNSTPHIVNVETGEKTAVGEPDWLRNHSPQDWSTDGERILFAFQQPDSIELSIYDLVSGEKRAFANFVGSVLSADFMADGRVLVVQEDPQTPPHAVVYDPNEFNQFERVLGANHVPAGRPWQSVWFESSDGTSIQGWFCVPEGDGPFPLIVHAHGGPSEQQDPTYAPGCQTWVAHGYAYLSVNYRGSSGRGIDFEREIIGQIGQKEPRDLAAGAQYLIDRGIADPAHCYVIGSTYGGFLALMALIRTPQLWAGAAAHNPITDWATLYAGLPDHAKVYAEYLFGGSPDSAKRTYRQASVLLQAHRIQAPVLLLGEQRGTDEDLDQINALAEQLAEGGATYELLLTQPQGSFIEEKIARQEAMMRFIGNRVANA